MRQKSIAQFVQENRTLINAAISDYRTAMEGIWSSCVGKSTIDEAPDAYKPAEAVEAALVDTVEVQHHLKPIYNFKAGEEAR